MVILIWGGFISGANWVSMKKIKPKINNKNIVIKISNLFSNNIFYTLNSF